MSQFTVALSDADAATLGLVGGKGASLARLVAAGLPVPAGFCVTTAAYATLVDDADVRAAVRALSELDATDAAAIAERAADARSLIRGREFPEPVRRAVADALSDLPAEAYAVRSSATAEDLPTASFAGQHESFLGVPAAGVLDAVRDCMASLFTDRAVSYRLRNRIPHADVALAVVVQGMVDPAVAGVLFTADPLTGNRRVASVDAAFGLGEALVSGAVSADNARVDRRTGDVLAYEVGEKRLAARRRADAAGTETVAVPAERRTARALIDDRLRTLVALGDRVESLLGAPQDVEWALTGDGFDPRAARGQSGEFRLLQARPITSLFPLPEPEPADDRLHAYLSFGHVQAMPEALPPLVVDCWRSFLNDVASVASADARAGRWAVAAGGRVYADLTPALCVGPLRRRLPARLDAVNEPAAEGVSDLLSRRGAAFPDRSVAANARAVWRLLRRARPSLVAGGVTFIVRFGRAVAVGPPDPWTVQAAVEAWGADAARRTRAPETLSDRVRNAVERQDAARVLGGVVSRVGPYLLAGVVAGTLLERLFPDAADDVAAVGSGFEGEVVTRMNQRLGDLADVARAHPAVEAALLDGASVGDVERVAGGDAFRDALDDYLAAFGHRATGEIDVSRPRWRDDPSGLLGTVRATLRRGEAGAHRAHLDRLERRADAARRRLEARANRGPLGPVRAWLVGRLIRTHRGGVQLREHPKQGVAHVFEAWHDVLSEAGEALAADGRLDRADDVWYLRAEEVLAALETDTSPDVDVDARRGTWERYGSMVAPPLLTSEGEDPSALALEDAPAGTLTGTPVSPGVVEGVARVVRDPTETTVEAGEVLVAPSCDPGWTPLFLNAAALVTEVGGRMTHGALVAREYGLPAVASVPGATTRIVTGERVRVDGTHGTVERLDADD